MTQRFRIDLADAPWIAAVVAILVFGFAAYESQRISGLVVRGAEVAGVIVRFDQKQESDWDEDSGHDRYRTVYAPVVRFTDAAGQTRTARAGQFSSWRFHAVGDQVAVLYDPHDPTWARINSAYELWSRPLLALFAGLVMAAVALGAYSVKFSARRRLAAMQSELKSAGLWSRHR